MKRLLNPQNYSGRKQAEKAIELLTHATFHEKGKMTQRQEPWRIVTAALRSNQGTPNICLAWFHFFIFLLFVCLFLVLFSFFAQLDFRVAMDQWLVCASHSPHPFEEVMPFGDYKRIQSNRKQKRASRRCPAVEASLPANTLPFAQSSTFLAFVYRSYSYHSICKKTGEARRFSTTTLSTFCHQYQ